MTQPHTDVIPKDQHDQIERIKTYDAGCRSAFGQQMGYAFLAGLELNAMKERCQHGQFAKLRDMTGIPERSAQRYMAFQDAISKSATVADLPTAGSLRLTNGQLPEREKEKVLKAVHKIADGKTLTELYRDLGIIRDKEEAKHHARKMTPEEKVRAEQEQAEAIVEQARADVQRVHDDLISDDGVLASRIKRSVWKEFSAMLLTLRKAITPFTRSASRTSHQKKN